MNKVQSTLKMKCPQCRKGDLFIKPFDFSKPLNMHSHCEVCKNNFEPEPGYYFGAMFISYIWTGWLCLFAVGFTMIVLKWNLNQAIGLLFFSFAISFFWVMRVSRSIYAHIDMKYKPEVLDKVKVNK